MVARYYRGRMTIDYLMSAPLGVLHYFYYTAVMESQTDEGKTRKANEELEDALQGG
jgi:hypothetical protein